MSNFAWLIEAPGPKYLGVRNLSNFSDFIWTSDHNAALRFESKEQADGMNEALHTLDRMGKHGLFGFEASLGAATAREHGWMDAT